MRARAKDLIGRTIVAVDMCPFDAGTKEHPRGIAHDPRITLDNGVVLYFLTEETEVGEYGVLICRTTKPRRAK